MKQSAIIYLKAILCALLLSVMTAEAQNYERMSEYEQNLYGASAHVNGDYETMKSIRAYWVKECNKLKSRNCEFVLCGTSEAVLKVTIPARLLFVSGEATLSPQADAVLSPLLRFVSHDDAVASCIVSCHSDNNGSERYLSDFTKQRAYAVSSWMLKQGVNPNNVQYFGLGNKIYKTNNDNVKNRELNRRVTIYFVPNKKMLKMAKKGQL